MKRKIKPWIVLTIKIVINLFFIVLSGFLYFKVKEMDLLPNKYLRLAIIILICFNLISMLFLFFKGIVFRIVSGVLYIVLLALCIIGIKYSNTTIKFLNRSFGNMKEYITYEVIVLKDSSYEKLEDLNDKKIGYLTINDGDYLNEVKNKVNITLEPYDLYTLYKKLNDKRIDAIVIGSHYLDLLEEQYEGFNDTIRTLYSYDIEIDIEQNKEKIKELKPVTIYISGLDNRSTKVESTGKTDVNMILTINPQTKTILITSIPRDYYVHLNGISDIKDKLSYTGIYGIGVSKAALEEVFDIKIDYVVKVGFVSVVNIVDLIGGIDIYSYKAFNSHYIKGWLVKEGMNHMDGAHALAYARERTAYPDGDDHRVLNQQQVFEAVFNKIITNKDMLYKYDTLLKELSNLYITDIPKEYITLLIKSQINDMRQWKVIKQSVYGEAMYTYGYTLPGVSIYVKVPNMETVEAAKAKMEEVLNN